MRRVSFVPALSICAGCADDTNEPRVVAEYERPTADQRASYQVKSIEVDGVIATLVGTPFGYPEAIVDDQDPTRIEIPAAASPTTMFCEDRSETDRRMALEHAAASVATHKVEYPHCFEVATWTNELDCVVKDDNGNELSGCDHAAIMASDPTAASPYCLSSGTMTVDEPNPHCDHDITSGGSGSWDDWEGHTATGTSRVQAEFSSCDPLSTTVIFWMQRERVSDSWGGGTNWVLPGTSYWKVTLDAGTKSGRYRGLQFLFHVNGSGVRPIFAGARMEGISRDECPTQLFW